MKVLIENNTSWPTRMLRPFVVRIAREEFPGTKPSNTRSRVRVVVGYNRGKGSFTCSGHAYYNSSTAYVNVPNPAYSKDGRLRRKGEPHVSFPVLDFCHVVGHEFGHCKGLKHAAMGLHYDRGPYSDTHYDWAKALPVPVVVEKRRPTTAERQAAELQRAQGHVQNWARKLKLATTKRKLWERRVRVLQRRIEGFAVAACRPEVPHGQE